MDGGKLPNRCLGFCRRHLGGRASGECAHVTGTLLAGGGVPVEANSSIVNGIGVSGAPSGGEDDAYARVIIDAFPNYLAFCTGNHLLNKTKR